MFKNLFKKTTERAEKAIDETSHGIKEVTHDAKSFLKNTDKKITVISVLLGLGVTASIISSIMSIKVGLRTIKSLNEKEIIENVYKEIVKKM